MFSLDSHKKILLLKVARRAITEAVGGHEGQREAPPKLTAVECAGAFVTLRRNGRLRGCIGQIDSNQTALDLVEYSARAAALHDPRFRPVRAQELAEIEIEISILSPPKITEPNAIETGRHGLIVSRGFQRGVLLPQVATEHGWERLRFLEETCAKAGLERDAWMDPETQILAFTALVFSESDPLGISRPKGRSDANPNYSSST
jgi:AmmeMemoRadiSam system protein A